MVVLFESWVGLGGGYNAQNVCTRVMTEIRERGFNLGGVVKGRLILVYMGKRVRVLNTQEKWIEGGIFGYLLGELQIVFSHMLFTVAIWFIRFLGTWVG